MRCPLLPAQIKTVPSPQPQALKMYTLNAAALYLLIPTELVSASHVKLPSTLAAGRRCPRRNHDGVQQIIPLRTHSTSVAVRRSHRRQKGHNGLFIHMKGSVTRTTPPTVFKHHPEKDRVTSKASGKTGTQHSYHILRLGKSRLSSWSRLISF